MLTQNSLALEAQRDERPLAKKQEQLQDVPAMGAIPDAAVAQPGIEAANGQEAKSKRASAKALLKNDDRELERVRKVRVPTRMCSG